MTALNAEYLEFNLDDAVLREVETLARAAGATPFEMCVTLLREAVLASASPGATPARQALNCNDTVKI